MGGNFGVAQLLLLMEVQVIRLSEFLLLRATAAMVVIAGPKQEERKESIICLVGLGPQSGYKVTLYPGLQLLLLALLPVL